MLLVLIGILASLMVGNATINTGDFGSVIGGDITYQKNAENYIVLHTQDKTFDIYQNDKYEPHLTGSYVEYSDRYVFTYFGGFGGTDVSMKVSGGIQALKNDGTLGKVWNRV